MTNTKIYYCRDRKNNSMKAISLDLCRYVSNPSDPIDFDELMHYQKSRDTMNFLNPSLSPDVADKIKDMTDQDLIEQFGDVIKVIEIELKNE